MTTTHRVAVLATDPARRDLALLALRVPFLEVASVGGITDTPPPADVVVAAVAGSGEEHRDRLEHLATEAAVFLVVDDPGWGRADDAVFAAVVPANDPMALFNIVRRHLEIDHDPVGPWLTCLCGRRLPVLQATFDVRTHEATVHCDRCGWMTSLEPLEAGYLAPST